MVRPSIQGESVHCGEDQALLCFLSYLGQASQGEGIHGYGIYPEVQLDFCVGPGWEMTEGIHQEHLLTWPVCDDQVLLLQSEEHPLKSCRGCYEILQADHLEGLVVCLHNKCPAIQVCMELFTAINYGEKLSLNVGIVSFSVCEGLAHKSYGVSILDDAGSQPFE